MNNENLNYITVGEFIIAYGIEKLQNHPVVINGVDYRINLSEFDFDYHNRHNFYKEHKHLGKGYFERFHRKGNYRLVAVRWDEEEKRSYARWVNKTQMVIDYNDYLKYIEPNQSPIIKYQVNRRSNLMHPATEKEVVEVCQFASTYDAKKYAIFRAGELSKSGYNGEITYQTEDGRWHYLQMFK